MIKNETCIVIKTSPKIIKYKIPVRVLYRKTLQGTARSKIIVGIKGETSPGKKCDENKKKKLKITNRHKQTNKKSQLRVESGSLTFCC